MAFLQDITFGQYYPVSSPVHERDPRTKLITALALMIVLISSQSWPVMLGIVLFLGGIIGISRIPFKLFLRNLRPFVWLFGLTFFLHLFFTKGRILFFIPVIDVPIYREAVQNGVIYTFRILVLILIATQLSLTTSPVELTDALDRLLRPLRRIGVPTYDLVMMLTLALRFVPVLLAEAERIRKAQLSRGASFDGNIWQRIKNTLPLLLPLFISAFRRADELAMAMDARCYHGGPSRTRFKELKFQLADYWVIGASIAVLATVFVL
ncbi:energy-coupling factor transporter transmembrane protein EcfT [bacterium]|nr:energy-coupling factor transporter transmembrane protein EcfT [bacterium]